MRLLKDKEIKFSTDRFLLNKWLFAKINEHFQACSRLDLFVIMIVILREFQSFAFKSQWTESEWKKTFFDVFKIFFLLNKSILIFHVSFCSYFEYVYFFIPIFFHTINIFRFINEKRFFVTFDFFSRIFFTSLESRTYAFLFWWSFNTFFWEMLVYNFFLVKFYFYWTILATRVYEGEVYYYI